MPSYCIESVYEEPPESEASDLGSRVLRPRIPRLGRPGHLLEETYENLVLQIMPRSAQSKPVDVSNLQPVMRPSRKVSR